MIFSPQINDTISAVYALKIKGTTYIDLNKYSKAKENLLKSLEILSGFKEQSPKYYEAKRTILFALTLFYRKTNNLELALEYNNKCLSTFQTQNSTYFLRNITTIL